MMQPRDSLAEIVGPVRDLHIAEILEALGQQLDAGAVVDAEPVDRDAEGRVSRAPPLNLPRRRDLRARRAGRVMMLHAPSARRISFAPVSFPLTGGAEARVAPFHWGAVAVRVGRPSGQPDWAPLRLWFLEWFQARFGEESPDLLGVAHAIEGPVQDGDGWRFTVDLGSASVACFDAMLEAFGRTGCADVRVGETATAP